MEDMKWWWDGLTLARGAEAQATPHRTVCWLKKNGWQPWFLVNCPGKSVGPQKNNAQTQVKQLLGTGCS